jgi:hypothetical protein
VQAENGHLLISISDTGRGACSRHGHKTHPRTLHCCDNGCGIQEVTCWSARKASRIAPALIGLHAGRVGWGCSASVCDSSVTNFYVRTSRETSICAIAREIHYDDLSFSGASGSRDDACLCTSIPLVRSTAKTGQLYLPGKWEDSFV